MGFQGRARLLVGGPGQHDGAALLLAQQLADDGDAVGHGLTGAIDGLGQALAQGPVVVDTGEAEVSVGQPPKPAYDLVRADRTRHELVEKAVKSGFVHCLPMLPRFGRIAAGRDEPGPGPVYWSAR